MRDILIDEMIIRKAINKKTKKVLVMRYSAYTNNSIFVDSYILAKQYDDIEFGDRYASMIFSTRFFANRYFNKLKKKYNLKEVSVK